MNDLFFCYVGERCLLCYGWCFINFGISDYEGGIASSIFKSLMIFA